MQIKNEKLHAVSAAIAQHIEIGTVLHLNEIGPIFLKQLSLEEINTLSSSELKAIIRGSINLKSLLLAETYIDTIYDAVNALRTAPPLSDRVFEELAPSLSDTIVSFFKNLWDNCVALFSDDKAAEQPFSLESYKQAISNVLDTYISWWKISLFGHHHNERAEAVKTAVNEATSTDEIGAILRWQKTLMEPQRFAYAPAAAINMPPVEEYPGTPEGLQWQNVRWNFFSEVRNRPDNVKTSGYYQTIEEACGIQPPSAGRMLF